jgi:hypothetical protein
MEDTESIADIYASIKPLMKVSIFFCLTPFSFIKRSRYRRGVLPFWTLHLSVCVAWTICLLTSTSYTIYSLINFSSSIPEKIKVTFILYAISLTATNLFILIKRICFNKRDIFKIFKKMRIVDGIIGRQRAIKIYRKTRLSVLREVTFLFFVLLITHSANYYIRYDGGLLSVVTTTVENCSYAVNIVMVLQYVNLLRMLVYRYECINNRILEYSEIRVTADGLSHNCPIHHAKVNEFYNRPYTFRAQTHSCMKRETCSVYTLRLAYFNLYDIVTLINCHFGVPLLLQIFTLMTVCVTFYYYGLYIFDNISSNVSDVTTYLKPCFLMLSTSSYALLFAWMIACCHNAKQEGKRGLIYVERVTACPNTKYSTVLELQALSHQLENMKIEFTACGFFVLNLPLLGTVIGGIFTYILIMIQLH